jgi:hypothetical protein
MGQDDSDRRTDLLARCDELIGEQAKYASRSKVGYHVCFCVAAFASLATPMLIGYLPAGTYGAKVIEGGVSALGALCLGLLARFKWDRDFVRHSSAVALLKSEKSKFNTRTTPRYAPGAVDAMDTFSTSIEAIYLNEVAEFVEQTRAQEPAASGLDESSAAKHGPKHASTRRSK